MNTHSRESTDLSFTRIITAFRRMLRGLARPLFVFLALVLVPLVASISIAWLTRASVPYNWAAVTSDVNPIRTSAAISLDGTTTPSQVLLFGGKASNGLVNDTWVWNGTTWTKLSPATSPPARSGANLVYDPLHHQDILFGGSGSSGLLSDTWVWNGTTWTKLSPATSPPARQNAMMAWDAGHSTVLLFGGTGSKAALNDTWSWNGTTWTQLSPKTKPAVRSSAAFAFDPVSKNTILFGGTGSKAALNDTWSWNGTTWTQLAMTTSPSARSGANAASDPIMNQLVLFGGLGTSENNDTWVFAQTTWTKLTPAQAPSIRDSFGLTSSADGSLVLVDGKNGSTNVGGTWIWQTTPSIPQNVQAVAGNGQAAVSWNASLSGGSSITSYTVVASPSGITSSSTGTSTTVVGLKVGTTYTFTVTATNALGTTVASPPSNSVTTWSYPSAPTNVTATGGNAQAAVSWQAPTSNGGNAISSYVITPYIGTTAQTPMTVSGTTLSTTIGNLTNGTTYTFAVAAVNGVGAGAASSSVAVVPMTTPSAPANVAASYGNAQSTVSWQMPANNGGSPVSGYVVTEFIGSAQQSVVNVGASTMSSLFTGLTNGMTYTFTVAAINVVGSGPAGTSSVTPTNVPTAPIGLGAVVNGPNSITLSWQTPAFDGGSPITGYIVTPYQGLTALSPISAATSPTTINGLNGSTTYTFTVVATNVNGNGVVTSTAPVTTAMVPCPVTGATNIWTGAADATNWSTAGNWSAGRQPSTTDFVCLPAGTLGSSGITVPSNTTISQLTSYIPLTIPSGLTAPNGVDFEANAAWTGGTLNTSSITIGSTSTSTVSGFVTLAPSATVTNNGSLQIVSGTITGACGGSTPSLWTNYGTLNFADSGSSGLSLCGGTFVNAFTGIVGHIGLGGDTISAARTSNAGTITAQAGLLTLNSTSGSFTSGFVGGGPGQIDILGTNTDSSLGVFGDNVWVTDGSSLPGSLTGTTVIAANATLHVGIDPAHPVYLSIPINGNPIPAATIAGTVAGAGTLSTAGGAQSAYPYFINTAVVASDLNMANATLGSLTTLASKPDTTTSQIGSNSTVSITGTTCLAGAVAIASAGTIQTVGGNLGFSGQCVSSTPSLTNTGTIALSNGSLGLGSGSFTNSGTITNATNSNTFSAATFTNTGSITANSGTLWLTSSNGAFNSGTVAGASGGQVNITNTFTDTANATFGDNVWVTDGSSLPGSLTGTTVIAANATLHVGIDPAHPVYLSIPINGNPIPAATIAGTVAGAGTLSTAGGAQSAYPYFINTAVVASDLNMANATLGSLTTLASKPDLSPSAIGTGAVVTVLGDPTMADNLTLENFGTLNYGSNGYFSCGSCQVTNESTGVFQTYNPDGSFLHIFYINSGKFDNEGLIDFTGYIPGTLVLAGANATLMGAGLGNGEEVNLQQPSWAENLRTNTTLSAIAGSMAGASSLSSLGNKALMALSSQLSDLGVGECENVNFSLGVPGASVGVCLVIDPAGREAVTVSVSGGVSGGVAGTPSGSWELQPFLGSEPSLTVDAGIETFWNNSPTGQSFNAYSDLDGLSLCDNGVIVVGGGVTGQHCWGPGQDTPFPLGTIATNLPGNHSGYLGIVIGSPSVTFGKVLSYSVTMQCSVWYSLSGQPCPPINSQLPSISGTTQVNSTLSVNNGSWSQPDPAQPLTYTYQWMRCESNNTGSCAVISGATSSTYTLAAIDQTYYITAAVVALNVSGASQQAIASPVGPTQPPQ